MPVGAHYSVVGADLGFRAPFGDQESVRDLVYEDSGSASIAVGQRPRQSFRHRYGLWSGSPRLGEHREGVAHVDVIDVSGADVGQHVGAVPVCGIRHTQQNVIEVANLSGCEVGGPGVHDYSALGEQVAAPVGAFCAADDVSERSLGHLAGDAGLCAPVPERGSQPVGPVGAHNSVVCADQA